MSKLLLRRLFPTIVVVCVLVLVYLNFTTTTPELLTNFDLTEPRILLVSALFPLHHAKHTHKEYTSWLRNFLGPSGVQTDVYFYTTPELESLVSSLHSSSATHQLTINTTYTPFVPPLFNYTSKYHEMHAWDRERAIHSAELYAVWNAKPWLLEHAVLSQQEYKYDYAFWVDAGSFRAAHPFRRWPDPGRVEEVLGREKGKDKVLIPLYGVPGLKEYMWRFEMGPVDVDLSEGSFFGSTPAGIQWFTKTFYQVHDWYITTSPPFSPPPRHPHFPPRLFSPTNKLKEKVPFHFVGKDQTLINVMLFRYPDKFVGILPPSRVGLLPPPPLSTPPTHNQKTLPSLLTLLTLPLPRFLLCGDWWFYQWFLASDLERARARREGWLWCGSGMGRVVVDVEGMLRGLFGGRWVEGRSAGGA